MIYIFCIPYKYISHIYLKFNTIFAKVLLTYGANYAILFLENLNKNEGGEPQ